MKKIVAFLCICFIFSTTVLGQNIDKSYTSSVRGDESVYFIYPMNKYKSKDTPKELEYDITYNHKEDSINYNFTFYAKQAFSADSVSIGILEDKLTLPTKILFIEPKKDLWVHRVSLRVPYEEFKSLYSSVTPYKIDLQKGDKHILFEIKPKDWSKQSSIIKRIIEVIELNKK